MNHPARGGAADLTGVQRDGAGKFLRRVRHVHIVEHDRRAFASEFEFAGNKVAPAHFADLFAHLRRAGERHAPEPRMTDQRRAGIRAIARHDIEHPRRQPGFRRKPCGIQRGQRRDLGRLDHHRVAGCQRGADAPAQEHERKVPGKDKTTHAIGRAIRACLHVPERQWHAAGCLHGEVRIVAEALNAKRHVKPPGRGDGFAHVKCFELCEFGGVLFQRVGEAVKQHRALVRTQCRPGRRSVLRRAHRQIDFLRAPHGHLGQHGTLRGIHNRGSRAHARVSADVIWQRLGQEVSDVFVGCGLHQVILRCRP